MTDMDPFLTLIVGGALLLMAVTLTLVMLFSTISSNADISDDYSNLTGYRAAGAFHVATTNQEFGRYDRAELEDRIENEEALCKLDLSGFRQNQPLEIGMEGSSCGGYSARHTTLIVTTFPLYSPSTDEFFEVIMAEEKNVPNPMSP